MEDNEKYLNVLIKQKDYFQYICEQEQKRAVSIIAGEKVMKDRHKGIKAQKLQL